MKDKSPPAIDPGAGNAPVGVHRLPKFFVTYGAIGDYSHARKQWEIIPNNPHECDERRIFLPAKVLVWSGFVTIAPEQKIICKVSGNPDNDGSLHAVNIRACGYTMPLTEMEPATSFIIHSFNPKHGFFIARPPRKTPDWSNFLFISRKVVERSLIKPEDLKVNQTRIKAIYAPYTHSIEEKKHKFVAGRVATRIRPADQTPAHGVSSRPSSPHRFVKKSAHTLGDG